VLPRVKKDASLLFCTGISTTELVKLGGSKAILKDKTVAEINHFDEYFRELEFRRTFAGEIILT
jgi:hypothetical protein